jgi:hypothetical protein
MFLPSGSKAAAQHGHNNVVSMAHGDTPPSPSVSHSLSRLPQVMEKPPVVGEGLTQVIDKPPVDGQALSHTAVTATPNGRLHPGRPAVTACRHHQLRSPYGRASPATDFLTACHSPVAPQASTTDLPDSKMFTTPFALEPAVVPITCCRQWRRVLVVGGFADGAWRGGGGGGCGGGSHRVSSIWRCPGPEGCRQCRAAAPRHAMMYTQESLSEWLLYLRRAHCIKASCSLQEAGWSSHAGCR